MNQAESQFAGKTLGQIAEHVEHRKTLIFALWDEDDKDGYPVAEGNSLQEILQNPNLRPIDIQNAIVSRYYVFRGRNVFRCKIGGKYGCESRR